MAATGFMLSDEGRTISVVNASETTAITAGDIVYAPANDDVLTGTAASARNAYAVGDIKVKSIVVSGTGYQTAVGVALEDIPASGNGAIAMEGIFIHQTVENLEAGQGVQAIEATTATLANKIQVHDSATTEDYKLGRCLTGGSADGKYVIWKMTL
ncbi:DUF2190 family protein [Candidatus Pacearchaeota archaeon]|nr:DUF2190 family protein [Candidatus Pacearchaeota archaeon]